ncbi:MAG: hypothetical protein LUG98_03625 [Tannerellaceae bacterium]|nr:hypothetical protein [Tannerellaceae bacterium]
MYRNNCHRTGRVTALPGDERSRSYNGGIHYSISVIQAYGGDNSYGYRWTLCGYANYWLATTHANNTSNAYYWNMSNGNTTNNNVKTNTGNRARCVR